MEKGQNFNHPTKGSNIKVEPIKGINDIRKIERLLSKTPRNLALFSIGINTPLKPAELLNIKVGQAKNITLTDCIEFEDSTTGNLRHVPVNGECHASIHSLLELRQRNERLDPDDYLFKGAKGLLSIQTLNNLVKKWCADIHLEGNFGSLSLRKTFGYRQLIHGGERLPELMIAFNHSTPRQTLTYLSISQKDLSHLKKNTAGNPPVAGSMNRPSIPEPWQEEMAALKQTIESLRESEEKLKTIFKNANDAIIYIDTEGGILEVNDKCEEVSGFSNKELKGIHFKKLQFISPRDTQRCMALIQDALADNSPQQMEFEAFRKDKKRVFVEVNPKTIKKDGQIKGFLAIIRDITERKRSEEALQESEEMARALLNATTDAVMLLNPDAMILDLNAAYADTFSLKREEMIGRCLWELIPGDVSVDKTSFNKVRKSGESDRFEKEYKGMWYDNVIYPVADVRGKISRIAIFSHDITRLKNAEASVRVHRDHLEELVKERTANLEESNTALKVLLEKGNEMRAETEEKILFNIKELVLPFLEKMKKSRLDERQQTYMEIMETNLNSVISPLMHGISSKYLNITPTEIQIADLIKHGKSSKDIAELLHMSPRTIDTHRYNIRTKMGLNNKKANLRSYLLSFC